MEENNAQNSSEERRSLKLKRYMKNLFNFSEYTKKTLIYIIIFIALVVFSVFLLYYNYFVDSQFLYRLVINWFVNPVFELGIIGIFIFILIMAFQGLLVPIPSELVLLATGMIWGVFGGGIFGIIGSMAAAILCFYVSKKGGRPIAEKLVGKSAITMADHFIHKYGMSAIIIARFLPFVAFDPISYASGLVDMDIKKYSIGSLIGSIPRAFFYSWLGSALIISYGVEPPINLEELPFAVIDSLSSTFNAILLIILGILVLMFVVYYIIGKFYEKKNKVQT
ncbi:MAG: DedA family protein [Promethearchaeota archaeon]|nr:MAG: DedA family protein [Candidatus Lokiarchaeota archaeon]